MNVSLAIRSGCIFILKWTERLYNADALRRSSRFNEGGSLTSEDEWKNQTFNRDSCYFSSMSVLQDAKYQVSFQL